MCGRWQRTIAIAIVAHYLWMVVAAPSVHHHDVAHVRGAATIHGEACSHCPPSRHAHCVVAVGDQPTVGDLHVEVGCADLGGGDCFVCRVLAQKHLTPVAAKHVFWARLPRDLAVVEPRPAARSLPLPWHVRAPPCIA